MLLCAGLVGNNRVRSREVFVEVFSFVRNVDASQEALTVARNFGVMAEIRKSLTRRDLLGSGDGSSQEFPALALRAWRRTLRSLGIAILWPEILPAAFREGSPPARILDLIVELLFAVFALNLFRPVILPILLPCPAPRELLYKLAVI